jgi:hypothetical protein
MAKWVRLLKSKMKPAIVAANSIIRALGLQLQTPLEKMTGLKERSGKK